MTTFHSLKVARVEPETRDAVTIFAFRKPCRRNTVSPGQRLTLKAVWAAKNCAAVAPLSQPHAGRNWRRGQSHRRRTLLALRPARYPGMELEVMVPRAFGYQPQAERQGEYLALPPVGITPMMAIVAQRWRPSRKAALRYLRQPQQP